MATLVHCFGYFGGPGMNEFFLDKVGAVFGGYTCLLASLHVQRIIADWSGRVPRLEVTGARARGPTFFGFVRSLVDVEVWTRKPGSFGVLRRKS